MKKISKALLLILITLSILLLSSCKGSGKNNNGNGDDFPKLPGTDYEDGVQTPILPLG
jgi:hypothetical protein